MEGVNRSAFTDSPEFPPSMSQESPRLSLTSALPTDTESLSSLPVYHFPIFKWLFIGWAQLEAFRKMITEAVMCLIPLPEELRPCSHYMLKWSTVTQL